MSDRYDLLRPFPSGGTFEIYNAVLCHKILHIAAGICDDGAFPQCGTNAALQVAGLVCHCGRTANNVSHLLHAGETNL